jgi:predicted nucleotidyltransferase
MIGIEEKIEILKKLKPELQKNYGVSSLGVFGSFVQGKQRRKSDLDILVDFEKVPTFFGFIRLERFLSKELNIKVDLVMKSAHQSIAVKGPPDYSTFHQTSHNPASLLQKVSKGIPCAPTRSARAWG